MKSIVIQSILALMSILLSASSALADRLYIESFYISPGETKDVSICLSNTQAVTAFQANLYMSDGLELVKSGEEWMTFTDRASSDHTLIVNSDGPGWSKLVCFSNTNTPFSGSEGALINMKVKAAMDFTAGTIGFANIKLSDSSNQDINLEESWSNVNVWVAPESVVLDKTSVDLKVGDGFYLIASVFPNTTTDQTIVWTSDNETAVTVDGNGFVAALALGSANITARCGSVTATCIVTVVATPVESVTISQPTTELKVGESVVLSATVLPDEATDKTVTWSSDNEAVATVDGNGNVTAVSLGTATITASCGNYSASCVVSVVATEVESVFISQNEAELKVGGYLTLTATVLPEDATDKTVAWTSDNEAVATVDSNGNVTAVSLGTATIIATCGEVSATCVVTVIATPAESVTLSQESAELKVGETLSLTATVLPEDATDKTVTWTSDNEAVATVDGNGNVTAVSLGTATITATSGNYSASCVVTVNPVLVESIILSTDNWSGVEGETLRIEATVLPDDATDKALAWTSSDESVATVDNEGNVSVLSEGTCVITASATDGSGITAECIITGQSGVSGLFSSEVIDVYDFNGVLIKKNADVESLKQLTPGMYIIRSGAAMKKLIIR